MTDEDKMIYKLTVHRNFIGWVIDKLKEEGILAQRTTGNDSKGDILLINPDEVPRVKEIIRQIQSEYNS
ncbi:hypothetical protein [Coleofasciculus sp. FACHB-SPT9]|jgi:hypothetical protein|uniref:hypothetical protein n=1 Tax=Cyanophyceae TaxID=3028117 RepID=UPI001688C7A2|nr:hypothetical protein [Coleofasciculus sp. FACHB-SPT9]MBD1892853.1 hypothetical protein [Coleofasciculus sp. FACHB-SPT9]